MENNKLAKLTKEFGNNEIQGVESYLRECQFDCFGLDVHWPKRCQSQGNPCWAWLFDGNAKDASENGKDGKLENGPTFVAGKIGQALKFAGGKAGNDRVNLGSLGLEPSGTATLVFWAKPAGAVLDDRMISNMNGPAVPAFSIRFAPPKVEFWGSTWQPVISKFDDNKWGHYAFTLDGKANVTGYYNGEKGLTTANNKYTFTDNISIGAPFSGKWGTTL